MIETERDYVKSLNYIIKVKNQNLFPHLKPIPKNFWAKNLGFDWEVKTRSF